MKFKEEIDKENIIKIDIYRRETQGLIAVNISLLTCAESYVAAANTGEGRGAGGCGCAFVNWRRFNTYGRRAAHLTIVTTAPLLDAPHTRQGTNVMCGVWMTGAAEDCGLVLYSGDGQYIIPFT